MALNSLFVRRAVNKLLTHSWAILGYLHYFGQFALFWPGWQVSADIGLNGNHG